MRSLDPGISECGSARTCCALEQDSRSLSCGEARGISIATWADSTRAPPKDLSMTYLAENPAREREMERTLGGSSNDEAKMMHDGRGAQTPPVVPETTAPLVLVLAEMGLDQPFLVWMTRRQQEIDKATGSALLGGEEVRTDEVKAERNGGAQPSWPSPLKLPSLPASYLTVNHISTSLTTTIASLVSSSSLTPSLTSQHVHRLQGERYPAFSSIPGYPAHSHAHIPDRPPCSFCLPSSSSAMSSPRSPRLGSTCE